MSVEKYDWAIQKSLFASTNQDSIFSHTRKNSKMLNIASKYFSFYKNKMHIRKVGPETQDPGPMSLVGPRTRDPRPGILRAEFQ